MRMLATLGAVIVATGLLSMTPSSLRSPETIVSLSMDTAAALMPGGGVPKRRDFGNGRNAYPTTKSKKHTW